MNSIQGRHCSVTIFLSKAPFVKFIFISEIRGPFRIYVGLMDYGAVEIEKGLSKTLERNSKLVTRYLQLNEV